MWRKEFGCVGESGGGDGGFGGGGGSEAGEEAHDEAEGEMENGFFAEVSSFLWSFCRSHFLE